MKVTYLKRGCGLALAAMLLLVGCSTDAPYTPTRSGIYIAKDGSVQSAEIESFDNSSFGEERYQEDELKQFVESAVSSYNQDSCGIEKAYEEEGVELDVCVLELTVENGVAKLLLGYDSCEKYVSFTEGDSTIESLSCMTVGSALSSGVDFAELIDPNGNPLGTKNLNLEKSYVVAITGTSDVTVQGKVLGVKGDVSIKDKQTVTVNEGEALIVFK